MTTMSEDILEQTCLQWLGDLGWTILHGPDLAPGMPYCERDDYQQVFLLKRLHGALSRINPDISYQGIDEAVRRILAVTGPDLVSNNRAFHRLLTDGVDVEVQSLDGFGGSKHVKVWLLDLDNLENNDWVALNQYTVVEGNKNRRADIVLFVNGLPLSVFELKNPGDENATIKHAFNQLQTYKQDIPSLFTSNELLVISDGFQARCGTITSETNPWQIVESPLTYGKGTPHFGGRRIGVVWHTQGSGKSLSMTFYAGKVIRHPSMDNPTLLVITDRNDLDDQLFSTFAGCKDLLRQSPVQADSRTHLRDLLQVASGGVVFSTIQKFMPDQKGDVHPLLSKRANIVVIADEAHRSQYDFIDGFARHLHDALPHASFIGFTGTPIERDDRSTPAVFGEYIDKYDILRAVEDGATVPIYYENRLARIELVEEEKPRIDPEFEDITEGEEEADKQKLRTKWAALEAMVGTKKRLGLVARDLVAHFEARSTVMDGKAMIVCMSRRIAVAMYQAIREIRPHWHTNDDGTGQIKIVMSGAASDHPDWQPHIRTKAGREILAKRFKDSRDELKLVIVRDMWLTGFDCPSLHTMYVDKPMQGHNLMQAIARVNRVFRDKPGGLVVDYIGLADSLKRALANYTAGGGQGHAAIDQEQALVVFLEKYEVLRDMLHGFDYPGVVQGPMSERITGLTQAMEFVLGLEDGKKRYLTAASALTKAFALAVPHSRALALRDEIGFFQELRAALIKTTGDEPGKSPEEMESAIRQLVSRAVASTEVVDIFAAAGMDKPDISILSDEFLAEVQNLPQRNLALELLKKLINDEIKTRSRKNIVLARSFSEMLEQAVRKYQNRAIEAAEVIQELIHIARDLREATRRGERLGLKEDEVAFYDALADNDNAIQVMGDAKLKMLAMELVLRVRQSVTIDWMLRENARAQIRVLVKRILRHYGYPPDMEQKATDLVLEQAEVLCKEWAASASL